MTRLRPLTLLLAGPIGVGAGFAVPFYFFDGDPAKVLLAALFGVVGFLPFFGIMAWAVSPTSISEDIECVTRRYRRFNRWVSAAGLIGLFYLIVYVLFDLHELLGSLGDWFFFASMLAVPAMAGSKIFMYLRLERLSDLAS